MQLATSSLHSVAGEWSGLVLYPFSSAEFHGFVRAKGPVGYFSVCVSCGSLKLLNRLLASGKSVVMLVMFWYLLQDPSMLLLSLWGHADALHL